jgi:hypothetical protein
MSPSRGWEDWGWLEECRIVATATHFFEETLLPETEAIDLLIVMGDR